MKKRIPRWTTKRKSISDGFVLKTDTDLKWEKRISSLSTKISARELIKILGIRGVKGKINTIITPGLTKKTYKYKPKKIKL